MLETQPSSHFIKTLASHPRRTNILSEWPCTLVTSAPLQMRASKPCRAELLCRRFDFTTVRLKVEENQLVDVFGEIATRIEGLKGA